mgnify:CR=1 FL=1
MWVSQQELSVFKTQGHTFHRDPKGFVYDEKSGEPVIFTNVFLQGTTIGAATDVNGFYSITKVPKGSYTLMVTSLGYDTAQVAVEIKGKEIINQKLGRYSQICYIRIFN